MPNSALISFILNIKTLHGSAIWIIFLGPRRNQGRFREPAKEPDKRGAKRFPAIGQGMPMEGAELRAFFFRIGSRLTDPN